MAGAPDSVLAARLATQRLTGPPLATVDEALRLLLCVQAQDAPLARWSLGMRVRGATDAAVRHAVDAGRVLRTHILRPTWHYVLAEDLRWLLALTSAKVEAGLAGRHRGLGLHPALVERMHGAIADLLRGGRFLTRRELAAELERPDLSGPPLGHLLLLAELRGVVCSGPMRGPHHTYALVEERVPPAPAMTRHDALQELARRFFRGHGPASAAHLARWAAVTQAEATATAAGLAGELEEVRVDGVRMWQDPARRPRATRRGHAFLLPVFDEAFLTYGGDALPRSPRHPRGDTPHTFAQAGGGVVVCDLRDVGWWSRTHTGGVTTVRLGLGATLDRDGRRRVRDAAERLAAFTGSVPRVTEV